MWQRPLTLRSKVVTTKIQLDINVERLLLNRGCLNRASRNSNLATHVIRRKCANSKVYDPRKTEIRFWRTDRNWPSRGCPGWSHPQFRVSLLHLCGRSRCNESFNQCWPLRSCLGRRRPPALKAS